MKWVLFSVGYNFFTVRPAPSQGKKTFDVYRNASLGLRLFYTTIILSDTYVHSANLVRKLHGG